MHIISPDGAHPCARLLRFAGGTGVAAAALVAFAAVPAFAHVSVTPDTTAAGSSAVLTFSVGHGCEGSPTTRLEIAMPEQVFQVTPTRNALWTVMKVTEQLEEAVTDIHGNEITERISQVVYTAKIPLPEGYRDTVELSLTLPDAEGETVAFPVVQTCLKGETGWIETPAEGQDPEKLDRPAPSFAITAATGGGHVETAMRDDEFERSSEESDGSASEEQAGDDDARLGRLGFGAGIAGLTMAAVALARTRKRS